MRLVLARLQVWRVLMAALMRLVLARLQAWRMLKAALMRSHLERRQAALFYFQPPAATIPNTPPRTTRLWLCRRANECRGRNLERASFQMALRRPAWPWPFAMYLMDAHCRPPSRELKANATSAWRQVSRRCPRRSRQDFLLECACNAPYK